MPVRLACRVPASPVPHLRQHAAFRSWWLALGVSNIGTWMQVIGISLLALRRPGSAALNLGTASLVQAIAFGLFSLGGGVITDRFSSRRVLLVTQPLGLLLALGFGVLLAHHHPTLLLLAGFAFLSAVVASVDGPARAALLPTLVPDELVMRAGAMLTLGVNVTSTTGPLLAGWVAGHFGLPAVFFLNAASFTGVIVVLARHAKDPGTSHGSSGTSPWAAMLEGLAVIREDVLLRSALLSYGVLLVFGPSPSFILPLAVGIDALLDGLVIGIGYAAGAHQGALVAVALTLEMLFLGLASAATLKARGTRSASIFALLFIMATLLAVGALVGATVLSGLPGRDLTGVLAFGTATLLYLVTEELLVSAHEVEETPLVTVSFFVGFLVVLIVELLL